jgi:TatD DNase family protein
MSAPSTPLVDSHAHIQDRAFDADREAVIERAEAAALRAIVCVGYDLESSRRAVNLAARHPSVFAAVGIHPNDVGQASDADWAELRRLARRPKVVGIGETGLDNYRKRTTPALQERWLWRHLDLAAELELPVVIHNRQADEQLRGILGRWLGGRSTERPPAVLHCFSSDRAMLDDCLDLGLTISMAGPVTFGSAGALRDVARAVPAGRLVVETDCPYLTPMPHRGKRNEPSYVAYTARALADLRGESLEQLGEHTSRAAEALFALKRWADQGAARR